MTNNTQPDPNAALKGFVLLGALVALGAAIGIVSQHLSLFWR